MDKRQKAYQLSLENVKKAALDYAGDEFKKKSF